MPTQKLSIDRSLCHRDGMCIAICPMNVLVQDAEGYPQVGPDRVAMCITCGHCVSVCTGKALSFPGLPAGADFSEAQQITREQAEQFFKQRRSVRRFLDRPVERDIVRQLLELTRWAPTAKNEQSVQWLVIDSKPELTRLTKLVVDHFRKAGGVLAGVVPAWDAGDDMILRDAPALIVAHAVQTAMTPMLDCTIALTHVDIAAGALHLGTCWAGVFMAAAAASAELQAALGLPKSHRVYGAMMLGYPKMRTRRPPGRKALRIGWR